MTNEEFGDNTYFRLTKECIMMMVLKDFGIDVNINVAKYIFEELFSSLVKQGYVKYHNENDWRFEHENY